jgi:hypothetical protein
MALWRKEFDLSSAVARLLAGGPVWPPYGATPVILALTSNFTNNTNTLNNTNLSFTVQAGVTYIIQGFMVFGNSTTTEGAKFDLGGGTCTATTYQCAFAGVAAGSLSSTGTHTLSSTIATYSSVTSADSTFANLLGYLKVNAGGTLIYRAAENTTATGTFTLYAGTWLALTQCSLV